MSAFQANLALWAVAIAWGSTFPLIKDALAEMGPASLSAWRFGLATLALFPFSVRSLTSRSPLGSRREALVGIGVGLLMGAGYWMQTIGLKTTTAGKAGFITGLYLAAVPALAWIAWREPVSRPQGLGVGLAVTGLALLTLEGPLGFVVGDLWVLAASLTFAVQIVAISRFAGRASAARLTLFQLLGVTVFCAAIAASTETPLGPFGARTWAILAYLSIIATTVAFLVQVIAQPRTTPVVAGLAMASEALWAALFGWMWAGETMTYREALGAALMVAAMILVQTPFPIPGRGRVARQGGKA